MRRLLITTTALLLGAAALLALPIIRTEMSCRGDALAQAPAAGARAEGKTFTTYPEWHIVHAYEDYAEVIRTGDPHDFGFLEAVSGFWGGLCPMARLADAHGGFTDESRMTIYTIGVSFTAEMALKALYEETLGRAAAAWRGPDRSALDGLSADQARRYAEFLRMTPWYRWDFRADAEALGAAHEGGLRDGERQLALGLEYRAKAAYAGLIGRAVAATGKDETRMVAEVKGVSAARLGRLPGVEVMSEGGGVITIDTPRYRAFTELASRIAGLGGDFVTIAGNDDIMLTALSGDELPGALMSLDRQGFGDRRHLIAVPVADLASVIRRLPARGARLEHVHDY